MSELAGLLERLFGTPPPPEARRKARLLVLDTLGCALAGFRERKVAALRSSLDDEGVAFAVAATWHEACEGLARAHGRPGVPVIAACVAIALRRETTLGAFLDAVISGYEVGGRMGERLRIRPGMHVDASWPALGAAAAAARLAGGSARTAEAAVEIAASQVPFSLYLPVEQGADARNTYLGHAAWLGLYAARAALAGCDAPTGAVARFGELALGLHSSPPATQEWLILEGYLKPFAAVRHVHYGAEAALRLRPQIAQARAIAGIGLSIYPEAITYCGNRAPRTAIQAQFSLSYGIAAALRFGRLDAEQYAPDALQDAELRRLESLVLIASDTGEQGRAATLVVDVGGRKLECRIASVKGDPASPMTQEECRAKFVRNARLPQADALADALLAGPEAQSIRPLLREALRP